MQFDALRLAILDEMKLPDFRGRHFFIVKLRLIIFIICWSLFALFYPFIWRDAPFVPLIFNLGFLATAYCYSNFVNERRLVSMGILEVVADVVSQTSIIYLLGADKSIVYMFYGLYVIAAGSFFGYITALVAATASIFSYCVLLTMIQTGWIPPYHYSTQFSSLMNLEGFGFIFNLLGLPVALAVIVYGTKIAHYFSKIKEKALETRNVQLLALNRIGSTIRRVMNLKSVIDQVLKGVIQGLGFDVCFLALMSKEDKRIRFYVPQGNPYRVLMEEVMGHDLSDLYLPLDATRNSAFQSIIKNRVIIRNDMSELTVGLIPTINEEKSRQMQQRTSFKKFVITPLVAERKVVGALIGASKKAYIEESVIDTLDNFANQVALAIESAQLIEELQKKNVELEEANRIKSDFLAIMSHELRTPLTAIIGFSEILLDNVLGNLNKDQRDSMSEVLKNAEDLLQLINNILDLAKVEAGRLDISPEKFDLADVIKEVQQTVSPLLAKKQHEMIVSVPGDIPKIEADPRKIKQILINLVGNAIKFTPDSGRIQISVDYFTQADGLLDEFHIPKGVSFDLPAFRISVKDSGIGIKEEHVRHIFDIFQQVDSTFTRKYQGTGLGLALSKQLVELHKGYITVDSEFGKGSEFKFLLPEKVTEHLMEVQNVAS